MKLSLSGETCNRGAWRTRFSEDFCLMRDHSRYALPVTPKACLRHDGGRSAPTPGLAPPSHNMPEP